jgi:hypothetical protein
LVDEYSRFERRFEEAIPPPATEESIQNMLRSASDCGLFVPESYLDFLRVRNGTSFNGLLLYAADTSTLDPYRRLELVQMNVYQFNRGDSTVLGTYDCDIFVIRDKRSYCKLDRISWGTIDTFKSCDELLVTIFGEQVTALESVLS